jgi:hypothetical protein
MTSAIVVAIRSVPTGLPFEGGIPEFAITTLHVGFGVQAPLSATATILNRLLTLWLRFCIGLGAQQWLELRYFLVESKSLQLDKV